MTVKYLKLIDCFNFKEIRFFQEISRFMKINFFVELQLYNFWEFQEIFEIFYF